MLVADHVQRVMKANFAASWEEIGEENQVEETFALNSMKNIPGGWGGEVISLDMSHQVLNMSMYHYGPLSLSPDAVRQISGFMGMQPCERSDKVDEDKPSHTLLLAGVYRGGHEVLVKARLAQSQGVSMKITVRSDNLIAAETIAAAVG